MNILPLHNIQLQNNKAKITFQDSSVDLEMSFIKPQKKDVLKAPIRTDWAVA